MDISLLEINDRDINQFKLDMQEAFQKGYEDVFGKSAEIILPEVDIEKSLEAKGATAYKVMKYNNIVGGAIVIIDKETQYNHLDFLYVKYGIQTKGIGKLIWEAIEQKHKDTKVWETCTPYFEKRNIHFYVNKCNFHIVEYQREIAKEGFIGDDGEGMFILKKWICD